MCECQIDSSLICDQPSFCWKVINIFDGPSICHCKLKTKLLKHGLWKEEVKKIKK